MGGRREGRKGRGQAELVSTRSGGQYNRGGKHGRRGGRLHARRIGGTRGGGGGEKGGKLGVGNK